MLVGSEAFDGRPEIGVERRFYRIQARETNRAIRRYLHHCVHLPTVTLSSLGEGAFSKTYALAGVVVHAISHSLLLTALMRC
jgi:hypothetical protein